MAFFYLPVLALFAASLVLGCDRPEESANAKPNTTKPREHAPMPSRDDEPASQGKGKYATVNGLKMYYEIHGTGKPLVLLHGAFGFATVYPTLAKDRQVIAVELQGHGHTGDIDRPLAYEQMADDVAALLKHLKVEQADVFGYSMGGNVGLAMAIRHPKLVRKLAINGAHAAKMSEAYDPATFKQFTSLPPDFAPPVLKTPYDKVAPDPKQWPTLVAKVRKMALDFKGYSPSDLGAIQSPVLITLGDRDGVRVEHAVEMFRQIPNSELAVFPGADHFLIMQSPEKLLPVIAAFVDAPMPAPKGSARQ